MFCVKCGQEIGQNAFCPNCGEKAEVSTQEVIPTDINGKIKLSLKRLGENKLFYFLTAGLTFLSFIFVMFPTIKATADWESKTTSIFGPSGMAPFIAIIYLAAIALHFVPFITAKPFKKIYFLLEKIITIFSLSFFAIGYFAGAAEASKYDTASIFPTFAGWIFLLSTVGAIVLSYMLSSKVKQMK